MNLKRNYACERPKAVLCKSSKSGWHFLFKEHIEQPQPADFNATRGFHIIRDSEFIDANKVFGAKRVDKAVYNRQGLAKVEHKPPMWKDLTELFDSTAFGLNDPEKIQNKEFFEKLSKCYTNHSIRATAGTILDNEVLKQGT